MDAKVRCNITIPDGVQLTGDALLDAFSDYFNRGGRVYTGFDLAASESVGVLTVVDLIRGRLQASIRLDPSTKSGRDLIARVEASQQRFGVTASATFNGDLVEMVLLEAERSEPKG